MLKKNQKNRFFLPLDVAWCSVEVTELLRAEFERSEELGSHIKVALEKGIWQDVCITAEAR